MTGVEVSQSRPDGQPRTRPAASRFLLRLRRIDPFGPLLTGAGLLVFLLRGFESGLVRDVALYTYSAQQFADGVPPYVAVINRAGPLAHIVPGLGVLVGRQLGADDLFAARVTLMLVSAGCVWAIYLAGRDLFGSRAAGAVAAATLLTFHLFVQYAVGGPREKTTMVLFITLAIWAATHRRWGWAGASVAMATLALQTGFAPAAAVVGVAALLLPGLRPRLAALARFAAGGLAVTAVFVCYFAAVGALPEFYECFLGINLGYTNQRGLLDTLADRPEVFSHGYGWARFVLGAGLLAVLLLAALRSRRLDRSAPRDPVVTGLAAGVAAAFAWDYFAFQAAPDAFTLLPFAALGVGGLALLLSRGLPVPVARPALVGLTVVLLVPSAVSALTASGTPLVAERQRVDAVFDVLGADTTLVAIEGPQALVLRGLRNPLREQMFRSGLWRYVDATRPGGLAGLAAEIEQIRPTLITVGAPSLVPWLHPLLERDYLVLGGNSGDGYWYVTNTVDPATVTRLRRIVTKVRRPARRADVGRSWP